MNMAGSLGQASWIWLRQEEEGAHQYVCFRRELALEAVPKKAVFHISVDSDFVLYVNGCELGRGQFSDYPRQKTFTAIDVAGALQQGENCIAILAYHRGEDFSDHRAGKAGLIAACQIDDELLVTDGKWKCLAHPAFTPGPVPRVTRQMGFTTCHDARQDFDWLGTTFDDSGWQGAALISGATDGFWQSLEPRPVSMLEKRNPVPVHIHTQGHFIRRGEGETFAVTISQDGLVTDYGDFVFSLVDSEEVQGWCANMWLGDCDEAEPLRLKLPPRDFTGNYFIIDLGRESAGLLHFDIDAPAGTVIDIGHGEHLIDGRVRTRLGERNFADRYICREGGNEYTLPFRRIGGRYLEVHISNYSDPLTIRYFGLMPTPLPGLTASKFQTTDTLAEKIHEIGVHSLACCMHEHYEDTPWREQSLYAFDSRNQALYGYYVFGNYSFAAASFELLGRGLREDGLLELCAPARVARTIPMFSLVWVTALNNHWLHSGDNMLFETFEDQIADMLSQLLERKDESNGLYLTPDFDDMWHFYEWTEGLSNKADGTRLDCLWNLFLHETLGSYSAMLGLSGKREEAGKMKELQDNLGSAIATVFWNCETGFMSSFIDESGHRGLHQLTQCLALHAGILDDEKKDCLLNSIQDSCLQGITLSSLLYMLETMMSGDEVSRREMASIIRENWGIMVCSGSTTCWETIKGAADFGGAGSLCHGWSALPVYYYHAYVLGIRPLTPGFGRFTVSPYSDLYYEAEGAVMTPHGEIRVAWHKGEDGLEVSVSHPQECQPEMVAYPECPVTDVRFRAV